MSTDAPIFTQTTSKQSTPSTHSTDTSDSWPIPDNALTRSISPTDYSQMSSTTALLSNRSWSERAEEDLVINLGQRERTRQEVLLDIVTSEERYVVELMQLKDTFIDPLLHPFYSSIATTMHENEEYYARLGSSQESLEYLPIAARFFSPTLHRDNSMAPSASNQSTISAAKRVKTPIADGESLGTDEVEDSPDPSLTKLRFSYDPVAKKTSKRTLPSLSRSHQSFPPPPRASPTTSSTSLGRQSSINSDRSPQQDLSKRKSTSSLLSRSLRKVDRKALFSGATNAGGVPPHQLPGDIRKCLEAIEEKILGSHVKLSERLRQRYDEQYPLVRSFADVFLSDSHVLHEYATYVSHLGGALEQVESLLSTASMIERPKQDAVEWQNVSKLFMQLEANAAEKGETGLAFSLLKPLQYLLSYPLRFQKLLFHTDPSTFEYEKTLQMVSEVEDIVRSISDEKIRKEERDKTRDVFARIEGLEKVKMLAVPKPSRILIEERLLTPESPVTALGSKVIKQKTSFRWISEVLQPSSIGQKDLWLIVFNDLVLRCQRTGTITLPMTTSINPRVTSLLDLQGKSKLAAQAQNRSRNLYKFIKIESWAINDLTEAHKGSVFMKDNERARSSMMRLTSFNPTSDANLAKSWRSISSTQDSEQARTEHLAGVGSQLWNEEHSYSIANESLVPESGNSLSLWGGDKISVPNQVVEISVGISGKSARSQTVSGASHNVPPSTKSYARSLLSQTSVPISTSPSKQRRSPSVSLRAGHTFNPSIDSDRNTLRSLARSKRELSPLPGTLPQVQDMSETNSQASIHKLHNGFAISEEIEKALATFTVTGDHGTKKPTQAKDGNETDESDRDSEMSFSYWGADKVTIRAPFHGDEPRNS